MSVGKKKRKINLWFWVFMPLNLHYFMDLVETIDILYSQLFCQDLVHICVLMLISERWVTFSFWIFHE